MMFGIPTADKPNVEPKGARSTMMFGAAEALSNPEKLTERTVRIGPEDLERMKREHDGGGPGASVRGTEMTPPETESVGPAHHQKTQMFAMSDISNPADAATPQEGRPPVPSAESSVEVQARHDRTAMFAMSPEAAPPIVQVEAVPLDESVPPSFCTPLRRSCMSGEIEPCAWVRVARASSAIDGVIPALPSPAAACMRS